MFIPTDPIKMIDPRNNVAILSFMNRPEVPMTPERIAGLKQWWAFELHSSPLDVRVANMQVIGNNFRFVLEATLHPKENDND